MLSTGAIRRESGFPLSIFTNLLVQVAVSIIAFTFFVIILLHAFLEVYAFHREKNPFALYACVILLIPYLLVIVGSAFQTPALYWPAIILTVKMLFCVNGSPLTLIMLAIKRIFFALVGCLTFNAYVF